jgi:hypothetical protein
MISYCIACYRPIYARLLIDDLVRKTTAPYEVLVWLNVADAALDARLHELAAGGTPVRVVGRTPHNIGMLAYRELFSAARGALITQIDDDVVCVSPGIAERAAQLFDRFPTVRQLVADVWQDEFTTGARPPLSGYRPISPGDGLYDGPIDGWFSIYHRSILPILLSLAYSRYFCLGAAVRGELHRRHLAGHLCTRMKVFHVIGPEYASLFGMHAFEIEKYRSLGRHDIVKWYEQPNPSASRDILAAQWQRIAATLERDGPW